MTLWHRLIGRIVKDGIAAGHARVRRRSVHAGRADHRVTRGRAHALAPLRRPGVHRSGRRTPHRARRVATRPTRGGAMTALETRSPSRTRRRRRPMAFVAERSRGRIPRSRASRGRNLNGLRTLARNATRRAAPPPAAALLGMHLDEVEPGRTVFSMLADEVHENPMGTMHGGIVATLVDTTMGCACRHSCRPTPAFTTLELKTNFVRAITSGHRPRVRRRDGAALRRPRGHDRSTRTRLQRQRCTRTQPPPA